MSRTNFDGTLKGRHRGECGCNWPEKRTEWGTLCNRELHSLHHSLVLLFHLNHWAGYVL